MSDNSRPNIETLHPCNRETCLVVSGWLSRTHNLLETVQYHARVGLYDYLLGIIFM